MVFKPFGKKYCFTNSDLDKTFPSFTHEPISTWIVDTIPYEYTSGMYWKSGFREQLQLTFRENYPSDISGTIMFILADTDRTTNFIALLLQTFAYEEQARKLESILAVSGSAYRVKGIDSNHETYKKYEYDLQFRVEKITISESKNATDNNELLNEAWDFCYTRNPDYEKTVSRACDFLEGFLGKTYFPNDTKPQLKKFVHAFKENPKLLSYKGDSLISPKNLITDLLEDASNIRGQHTQGNGRQPTKDEAEFVLHTTIYTWNLHQK